MSYLKIGNYKRAYEILSMTKEFRALKGGFDRNPHNILDALESGSGALYDRVIESIPDSRTSVVDFYILQGAEPDGESGTVAFILKKDTVPGEEPFLIMTGMGYSDWSWLIESKWLTVYNRYKNMKEIVKGLREEFQREYLPSDNLDYESLKARLNMTHERLRKNIVADLPTDEATGEINGVAALLPLFEAVFEELYDFIDNIMSERGDAGRPIHVFGEEELRGVTGFIERSLAGLENNIRLGKLATLDGVLTVYHEELFDGGGLLAALSRIEKVIFIPTRELFVVPLHLAYKDVDDEREYLFQRFTSVTYLPSVYFYKPSEDKSLTTSSPSPASLVCATVNLSGSVKESISIKSNLRDRDFEQLLGEDATRSAVLKMLESSPRKSIFYYIGHAIYNMEYPDTMSGFLVFDGEDDHEYLTLGSLKESDFTAAEAVILHGCETAATNLGKKDEYYGFPRVFMERGADMVVATAWVVPDAICYEISRAMCKRLRNGCTGADLSESVKNAQMKLFENRTKPLPVTLRGSNASPVGIGEAGFSHPFYWGAHMVFGY